MPSQSRRRPGRPAGSQTGEGREALLQAARDLLAERGMPRVTVREVAERAGVQPAMVNYYFGGKAGLLRAVVDEVASGVRARVRDAAAREGSAEDRLRALITAIVEALAADPYAPRLLVEQVLFAEDEIIDEFVDAFARANLGAVRSVLEAGRTSGTLRSVDPLFFMPSAVGAAIFFFLAEPIVRRLFGVQQITPELADRFAQSTADLLLHGVATGSARK
ncbi:MAG: TetR/AcrR family transcriptional regulator [Planctomycetota bacterium]|jgi:AcrR family transcriptional regulator